MGGLLECIEQQMNLNIFLPGLFILFYFISLFYFILFYFVPHKFYALSALTVALKIFVVREGLVVGTAQTLYPKNFNCSACES